MNSRKQVPLDSKAAARAPNRARIFWDTLLVGIATVLTAFPCLAAKKPFTVADDIAIAHFGDPYSGQAEAITFSPDRKHFVVDTERGLLESNRPESALRIFNTESVQRFLAHPGNRTVPDPVWTIRKSTYPDGPIIKQIRWLPDSSGLAYLQTNSNGYDQLFVAELKSRFIRHLTPDDQYVTAFDIRTTDSFVYIALSQKIWDSATQEKTQANTVGTGRILYTMLFPDDPTVITRFNDLSELWAVIKGKRKRVRNESSGKPIAIHYEGWKVLKLSPSGHSVITALAVKRVPPEWEEAFASRKPDDPYRIRAADQDIEAFNGGWYVSEYARINLLSGEVTALTNAPIGEYAGWWSAPLGAAWSQDGQSVVVSNSFLPHSAVPDDDHPARPCIVIVAPPKEASCLEQFDVSDRETTYRRITGVHFSDDGKNHVVVTYAAADGSESSTIYSRNGYEPWTGRQIPPADSGTVSVSIRQGLNDPPVLVATDTAGNSRVVLDPNPQLSELELSQASLYEWQDKSGRNWTGGLYKPLGYIPGRRYPLVIQTHGFYPKEFRPDGVYPTAFAAQELAASGIMVLQAPDCPVSMDVDEGPCSVALYESAVDHLVADGLADPTKVGIIGFSRTCYYVMEALTTSRIHFAAASITDGVNEGYFQYLIDIDTPGNGIVAQANQMMGAAPFGPGLQKWLTSSPEFNLDKVMAPLQVVVTRRFLVDDWEPYAALRVLNKPVDLIVLRNGTHVLTNPAERLASQGGSVDWFRFWLLDTEGPEATKAAQYTRWHRLRSLQQVTQTNRTHVMPR